MSLRLSGGQKVILWIGVALLVWQGYRNDHILSAAFTFVASGAVPGTNIILSPDMVLALLPIIFVLIVLLVFRRELLRLLRGLGRSFRRGEKEAVMPSAASAAASVQAVITASPLAATKAKPSGRRNHFNLVKNLYVRVRRTAIALSVWLAPRLYRLSYWLGYCWEKLVIFVKTASHLVTRHGRAWLKTGGVLMLRGAGHAAKALVALWKWAAPYLWRFDRWLGVQVHKALNSRRGRHYQRMAQEFKKTVRQLVKR